MRLSSLCLSTVLATATLPAGARGRGFAAAFAASSSTAPTSAAASAAAARRPPPPAVLGSALPPHGVGAAAGSPAPRAFVAVDRLRAGAAPLPPGPLRASTQESTDLSVGDAAEAGGGGDDEDDDDALLRAEVRSAARDSLDISGPSTVASAFGGLRYVDTSLLDSSEPKQHRVLFVLGGPGAGKGTQSDRIVESYKCVHLSVGELLRAERERGDASPHADLIEDALVNGRIVPVEISLELLRDAMDAAAGSPAADGRRYGSRIFLVDGFPRNFDNLGGWTAHMPRSASSMGVLCYDCPQDVLEQRILGRAETSGRSDDNLESARKRFRTFREQTMPVVHALEEVERTQAAQSDGGAARLCVDRIVADGTVEEVWERTREAMDGFVRNDVLSAAARLMRAVDADDVGAYAALCDPKMLVDDDDDDDDGAGAPPEAEEDGAERTRRIFREYEVARVETGPDGPTDAIRTPSLTQTNEIDNAEVTVQDGTHAVVSYDRTMKLAVEGQEFESAVRETRVWEHKERGWVCVHFYRKPL